MRRPPTLQALALASALVATGCPARPAAPPRVVTRASARAAPRPVSPAGEPTGALRDRVAAVAQAFRERNAHPVAERWVAFLPPHGTATMRLGVARAQCVGFVAVGRESLGDVNMVLHNAAGVRVGHDERSDAHPYVRHCARAGDTLHVMVVAVRGAGEVALLTLVDPPLVAPNLDAVLGVRASAQVTGPRTPRVPIGSDPAVPDAPAALERVVERFAALGYRRTGVARNGSLEMQQHDDRAVSLEAGTCYAIVAAGGAGVEDLDLRVVGPAGNVVAQDGGADNRPVAKVCPREGGPHRVLVRMYSGAGRWSLAVLAMDPAIELAGDVTGLARARALEIAAEARRHGMALLAPPVRAVVVAGVALQTPFAVRAGRCYAFGAAANELLPGLDLALTDEHGAVLAADSNARESARVFYCPRRDGRARVEVRGIGGRGEYVFLAFEGGG